MAGFMSCAFIIALIKFEFSDECNSVSDQILKLKKGLNKTDKKKKKDVNAQIALLQAELEKKHDEEMKQLQTQQVESYLS